MMILISSIAINICLLVNASVQLVSTTECGSHTPGCRCNPSIADSAFSTLHLGSGWGQTSAVPAQLLARQGVEAATCRRDHFIVSNVRSRFGE